MRRQVYEFKRKQLRTVLILFTAFMITIFCLVKLDKAIRPNAVAVCEQESKYIASDIIGTSIYDFLNENPCQYSDFTTLLYDEKGAVTAVETITEKINLLQAGLLKNINMAFNENRNRDMSISLGTATGIWLFAGHGPDISLRLMPVGSVDVKLISELKSAGINQTCHTIKIVVNADIASSIPFYKTETEVSYTYLLTETVIVGNIPDKYTVFGGQ